MADLVFVPALSGLAAGTTLYWLYFHRYETHMYGVTYLGTFLTLHLGGAATLVKVQGSSVSAALALTSTVALAFLLAVYGNLLIFRLFLHPLNRFPGPFGARLSSLWLSTRLAKSDGYYVLEDLHRRYGRYVRIGSNDLSIIDPDAVELTYGAKSRVTKGSWYDNDYPLTSLHTARDKQQHDRRRRVWAPAFADKALREYEPAIRRFSDTLVAQVAAQAARGQPVNVTKWFNLFSFDAMGLLAFGKEYGMLQKGEKPVELELLNEGMQPLAYKLPPWLFRLLTAVPGLAAGYQRFCDFCVNELTWRVRAQRAPAAEKKEKKRSDDPSTATLAVPDIMSWLLRAYADVPHPERDGMLTADTRLIIVAGSDTTAATLTFLFFHLAQRPDLVARLRAELEPLCAGGAWADADIKGATLLNACINEALRLHPPVPSGVPRLTPPEGLQVGDTYVPGNVSFVLPLYPMGRDARIYAEAERFLPERWTTQPEKVRHAAAFTPFSAGPMSCIGKNLALMELRTVTTKLLLRFDVAFAKGEDGRRILRESKDHFTMELGDLDLEVKERA